MSHLLTSHPIALRYLMNETIFVPSLDKTEVDLADKKKENAGENHIPSLELWGSNGKNILFFIRDANQTYFSAGAKDAFLKTLSALNLTLQDVAVINLAKNTFSPEDIVHDLKPRVLIYCDGEKVGLPFNGFFMNEDISVLYTHSFEEMLVDTHKKRLFWNAIKEIKIA